MSECVWCRYVIEIVAPVLIFAGGAPRVLAALLVIALQVSEAPPPRATPEAPVLEQLVVIEQ